MDEATNQNQETQTQETQETTPRTYTEEEVRELLQKEGDKRVSEAMKKAERKSQAKIKEATKLAQMNEEQKFQYELEQREKAIEAKEKELALAENKATASQVLADRGLSAKLVDMVVAEDADEMMDNIKIFVDADDDVKAAIDVYGDYIRKETLAVSIEERDGLEKYDLNGHKTGIGVERI